MRSNNLNTHCVQAQAWQRLMQLVGWLVPHIYTHIERLVDSNLHATESATDIERSLILRCCVLLFMVSGTYLDTVRKVF